MMYKRGLLLGIFSLCVFSGLVGSYGFAQEYTQEDMQKVTVRFCNETGESKHDDTIYVEPGKEKSLRLCVSNAGDKQVTFEYGFTIGEITDGGVRICGGDMGTGNVFSMLIPSTKERSLIIDPMSDKTIEEKIVIPPGMSGLQMGCLVYKLAVPAFKNVGGMFSLEVRKYGNIDIMVGGESTVKSSINLLDMTGGVFSTNKKIKAELDQDNNLTIRLVVENQGNITENVSITGKIYNALGFQKDFTIESKGVAPGGKNEFTTSAGILPIYKGLYSIKFNVKSDPQFLFPITNEKLKEPKYITEKGSIFIFSRILVVVLIVVLLIIYRLLVPKKNKVPNPYINPTPNPTV